jgi:hypothetical protein
MSDKVFIVPFSILLFSAQDIVATYKSTSIDKRNKGKDKFKKKTSSHLLKQRGSSSLTPPPPSPPLALPHPTHRGQNLQPNYVEKS